MSLLARLQRGGGGAHIVNYVVVGTLCIAPLLAYALVRSPSAAEVEQALQSELTPQQLSAADRRAETLNTFWKVKRNAAEMEAVYSGLLHAGSGGAKRQYELAAGSALAEAEGAQRPAVLGLRPDRRADLGDLEAGVSHHRTSVAYRSPSRRRSR